MQCLKPVCVPLSDDQRKIRFEKVYMPIEYRFATKIYVPCGSCEACLVNRRSQWTFRLKEELRSSKSCYFVTLTYDDDKLPFSRAYGDRSKPIAPNVCKRDVQNFLKRLRKSIYPFKIRYYLVSEYGPKTFRPHYHMVLFDFPHELKNKLDEYLETSWGNGFIRVDPISDARIHYVTGYCLDGSQVPDHLEKNFMLCSRKPAIGSRFLDVPGVVDFCESNTSDIWAFSSSGGQVNHVKIPRYYRERLFSEYLRDKISVRNCEYHADKYKALQRDQTSWLLDHGYPITKENLRTAFPTSPLDLHNQYKESFRKKVRSNFKNKKNG